jgi:hypothetical protein
VSLRQEIGRCLQAQNEVIEKLAGTWEAGRDLQQGRGSQGGTLILANRKAEIRQKGRLADVRQGFSGMGEIMQGWGCIVLHGEGAQCSCQVGSALKPWTRQIAAGRLAEVGGGQ